MSLVVKNLVTQEAAPKVAPTSVERAAATRVERIFKELTKGKVDPKDLFGVSISKLNDGKDLVQINKALPKGRVERLEVGDPCRS